MTIKILALNFPQEYLKLDAIPSNIEITRASFNDSTMSTLHDFHVLLIDASEVLRPSWWEKGKAGFISSSHHYFSYYQEFASKVGEQIRTGGITVCFSDSKRKVSYEFSNTELDNYFFCPLDLGMVNEKGDTFTLIHEELGYFNPLFNRVSKKDIEWTCYFSKPPRDARILGVNRAKYPVFMEVPIENGKLAMLPRFKNMRDVVSIIISDVIPQMIHEEYPAVMPKWAYTYSSIYEQEVRTALKDLETAKRLLYTKDKALKKAVAFGLARLGFQVETLPDGTLPDLRISDGELKIAVEVKGHENRQADRKDVLQLLGYLSEIDLKEKGVFVCNHEYETEPEKRSVRAFTEGALSLADCNNLSLVSSTDLYKAVIKTLENRLSTATIDQIKKKIMTGRGLVSLE